MTVARFLSTLILLVLVAAIGIADYLTGPDIGFSLFYLAPVVYAGWNLRHRAAVTVAVGAAAAWLVADLASRAGVHPSVMAWNGITRLTIYLAIGIMTALVRSDREELRSVNARLIAALEREKDLARTDVTTGLPNSRFLVERIREELALRREQHEPIALIYLDLDNFKRVNDIFGHASGDELLARAAGVLREVAGEPHEVARMGGDEFAVLLARGISRDDADAIAADIRRRIVALGADYPNSGFGTSAGVAFFDAAPADADTLIHAADSAMYDAKVVQKVIAATSGDA